MRIDSGTLVNLYDSGYSGSFSGFISIAINVPPSVLISFDSQFTGTLNYLIVTESAQPIAGGKIKGSVRIDNQTGGNAVNVQDGGNSLTIDNSFLDQSLSSIKTTLDNIKLKTDNLDVATSTRAAETSMASASDSLASLDAKDFATETTVVSIDSRLTGVNHHTVSGASFASGAAFLSFTTGSNTNIIDFDVSTGSATSINLIINGRSHPIFQGQEIGGSQGTFNISKLVAPNVAVSATAAKGGIIDAFALERHM